MEYFRSDIFDRSTHSDCVENEKTMNRFWGHYELSIIKHHTFTRAIWLASTFRSIDQLIDVCKILMETAV